jgi:hypothetical protein
MNKKIEFKVGDKIVVINTYDTYVYSNIIKEQGEIHEITETSYLIKFNKKHKWMFGSLCGFPSRMWHLKDSEISKIDNKEKIVNG